ncbi:aromatic acid exporter family protein [Paenibacillus sp. KQZ6P-2]|uniref:Aromatic acid exporter family protein n=1 Tax=Paenibacillus mangrovi TaxID=2931978 RepID=A0A9X1WRG1_9BACL|nr:aromatic acid exporter family protein [Paenibacillus mangrovi]MCJ8012580.1 aromatic acid exporter family protein [Paenibacillus mangrovi]
MGFRVIKTAIATLMSILIADTLGVKGPLSAGLLAILGVDVTRKRSIRTISARFFASLLGLGFACILFEILGFHYWVLALYILVSFPAIARANFKEGIVTSSVVVFRIYGDGSITLAGLWTQIELLVIGLGSALIVNLAYMPQASDQMVAIRKRVDKQFAIIFARIAETLRDPDYVWDGKELIEAGKEIRIGKEAAHRAMENQMLHPDEVWSIYFYMRREQLESIQNMMQLISHVYQKMPQADDVAELFEQLSHDVTEEVYTGRTEFLLKKLEQEFKTMELPTTREEFEIRSAILQLIRELSLYLKLAKKNKAPTSVEARRAAIGSN